MVRYKGQSRKAAQLLSASDLMKFAAMAEEYIRDWRLCDCGYEQEDKIMPARRYNTECGHAIDCDYYLADSLRKHLEKLANKAVETNVAL